MAAAGRHLCRLVPAPAQSGLSWSRLCTPVSMQVGKISRDGDCLSSLFQGGSTCQGGSWRLVSADGESSRAADFWGKDKTCVKTVVPLAFPPFSFACSFC